MKHVRKMILSHCPHCRNAARIEEKLTAENPSFADVEIEVVDEQLHPEIADTLDYYYVPCYFVDGKKIFEGVPDEDKIRSVFAAALDA